MFRFVPKDRDYTEWNLENTTTGGTDEILEGLKELRPVSLHLFPGDIIDADGVLKESLYREKGMIPGVLIVNGRTYGRPVQQCTHFGKHVEKTYKHYYKCVPYDKSLPCVLIPYECKAIGFIKKKSNLYVLFNIKGWVGKHPEGILQQTIGRVDIPEYFYDYQLHCYELAIPMRRLRNAVLSKMSSTDIDEILENQPDMENRTGYRIFSIDPGGTKDIDDAMGITTYKDDTGGEAQIISIYIANVPQWLNILSLWQHLTKRVATVYLPTKKLPMLHEILSEKTFSLIENKKNIAFVADLYVQNGTITRTEYNNVVIDVNRNYTYEEPELIKSKDYQGIFSLVKGLNACQKTNYVDTIRDSHDVVAYLMIAMNHDCAKKLSATGKGIYRSVTRQVAERSHRDPELSKFLNIWKYTSAQYSAYGEQTGHQMIAGGLAAYVQLTSPIRRIVDIVNMTSLQLDYGLLKASSEVLHFLESWMKDIDYINKATRHTRKVQTNCELLHYCLERARLHKGTLVDGHIIEKDTEQDTCKGTGDAATKYLVYIPSLKIVTKVISDSDYLIYEKYWFSVHLFTDQNTLQKKVRLQFN
jgi:exoribonuclease R